MTPYVELGSLNRVNANHNVNESRSTVKPPGRDFLNWTGIKKFAEAVKNHLISRVGVIVPSLEIIAVSVLLAVFGGPIGITIGAILISICLVVIFWPLICNNPNNQRGELNVRQNGAVKFQDENVNRPENTVIRQEKATPKRDENAEWRREYEARRAAYFAWRDQRDAPRRVPF